MDTKLTPGPARQKANVTRAVGLFKDQLIGELMTNVRDLSRSVGMNGDGVVKVRWKEGGGTDLNRVADVLKGISDHITDDLKTVDDRVMIQIPGASRMVMRLEAIDGNVIKALSVSAKFGMEAYLALDLEIAANINRRLGRREMANRLRKTKVAYGETLDGKLSTTVVEFGSHSRYDKFLR